MLIIAFKFDFIVFMSFIGKVKIYLINRKEKVFIVFKHGNLLFSKDWYLFIEWLLYKVIDVILFLEGINMIES